MKSDEKTLQRVFAIKWAGLYPMYVNKVERKGHTTDELDQVIRWLTGYTAAGLKKQLASDNDLTAFFDQAPKMNPNRLLVTGVICGVRVEEIEHPLMREIRILDKLVDELANGRAMEKILREPADGAAAAAARPKRVAKKPA
ncbi:MAG: DUF2200 domain-containing protein [Candidatus Thermoplasmatota archaeon]